MLRSILSKSSRPSGVGRFRKQFLGPRSLDSYSRREFSDATALNASRSPRKPEESPEPESPWPKILIGGMAVGIASMAAYQVSLKYSEKASPEGKQNSLGANMVGLDDRDRKAVEDAKGLVHLEEEKSSSMIEVSDDVLKGMDDTSKGDFSSGVSISEALVGGANEEAYPALHKSDVTIEDDKASDQQNLLPSTMVSNDQSRYLTSSSETEQDTLSSPATSDTPSHKEAEFDRSSTPVSQENGLHEISTSFEDIVCEDRLEDSIGEEIRKDTSLLGAYNLEETSENKHSVPLHGSEEKEVPATALKELNEAAVTEDGRLILVFLQAIHAAEKRQADLDSHLFAEEKRALKEKYEKELKDAIARELMHAEEAALLNKELKKERSKAAAALKALQQSLEDSHKLELAQKEEAEAESKLKRLEELAKLEMAAAIAKEKAAQIEKVAEANLHINALCMAFFARSEEARLNHSIHKLALGALALEDALDKGLPIKAEIESLRSYVEGIDKDSVLDLVLSSLPEETILHGTDTVLQLNQQFDTLMGTLRHFSLIPPGGGGILAHSLARAASWLKIKGGNQSGDDIESLIKKVENLLAEGNLAEAADALEEGVKGSQSAEIVGAWVKRVRNRAIAEQALTLLQSFASSASLT